ncbi:hypothetical protein CLV63_12620 [Murinocardiopsis flavida]|uniref:Uncharacterized protein n=1 Tax=Murinocardiopsis flavida TaxID=645275 RepID=A0A2P8CWN0_9ACTN|nr:hypothetical protein [Murinocardiopsis flavida]PSK89384.1 hypothetical protein CLV63_12620 [Murinocardiopsis flavida]
MGERGAEDGPREIRSASQARKGAVEQPARPDRDGVHGDAQRAATTGGSGAADDGPDVLLDVPTLNVAEIELEVDQLRARVSLRAEVSDLVKLNVGADVDLGSVTLKIKGVEAQALLKVRLDNVAAIIERVLQTIDENPQVIEGMTRGVGSALNDVGGGAGEAAARIGQGVGDSAEEVGKGAGGAVETTGRDAGAAVDGLGGAAGRAVGGGTPGGGQGPAGVDAAPADSAPAEARTVAGPGERGAPTDRCAHGAAQRRGRVDKGATALKVLRGVRAGARQVGREAGGVVSRAVKAAREAG